MELNDAFISVDIESSGQSPSTGSLIAIGAVKVDEPDKTFYVELWPEENKPWSEDAFKIHGLTRGQLFTNGSMPHNAMAAWENWLEQFRHRADGSKRRVTFVGWSATFDWMFVNDYFHKYLGHNPFGVSGMDLKAFYLGKHWPETNRWSDTAKRPVYDRYPVSMPHTHNALDDAIEQADLARRLFESGEYEGVKALPLDRKKFR